MNGKERRAEGAAAAAPDFADALLAGAMGHHQAGRLAEAEAVYRQLLAQAPQHVRCLYLLGTLVYQARRPDEAVELLGRAIALDEQIPDLHNNIGLAYAALGRFAEAERHFRRTVELQPEFPGALVSLGNALNRLDRGDEAIAAYRRALALKPDDGLALYNLGNAVMAEGALGEAVALYRRAHEINPAGADILTNLATALEQQGRADEALEQLGRALALRPNDARVHNNLGSLHLRQGRLDAAGLHYTQALTAQPGFVTAYNNLSHVLRQQGRPADALSCLEAGLTVDPDHPDTQLNICSTLYELSLEQRDAALAHAQRLLAAHGQRPLMRRGLSGLLGIAADATSDADYSRVLFDNFATTFDQRLAELGYLDMPLAIGAALGLGEQAVPLDILDAGCGTGLCADALRPAARTLTGVDVSPKMLAQARARGGYDRLERADAMAFMREHPNGFDVIVASDVLTYIGDTAGFLHAAHGALRTGGRLAISAESLDGSGEAASYRLAPSGRYQHTRAFLEQAFRQAGFDVRLVESVMRREAGQPLAAWIAVGEKRG